MANAAALINEGLWRKDKDFQRLPRMAQCTFCQVLSQKDLDTVGGLTLHLDLLAKACEELTVEQLMADFAVLEEGRFLFVDYDTDELLVRSYVRLVSARSGPKGKSLAWQSVPKNARLLGSEKLRHELAAELRRIRWKEADELADEIDPVPSSEPPSKPLVKGSPLQAPSKPHSQVPVPVLVSPSLNGYLGEEPPTPFCSKHPNGTELPCRPCGAAREAHDRYDEAQTKSAKQRRTDFWIEVQKCDACDDNGFADTGHGVTRCPNHNWESINDRSA